MRTGHSWKSSGSARKGPTRDSIPRSVGDDDPQVAALADALRTPPRPKTRSADPYARGPNPPSEVQARRVPGQEHVRGHDHLRDEPRIEVVRQRASREDVQEREDDEHGGHEGDPRGEDPRVDRQSAGPVVRRGRPTDSREEQVGRDEDGRRSDPEAEDLIQGGEVLMEPRREIGRPGQERYEQLLDVRPYCGGEGEAPEGGQADPDVHRAGPRPSYIEFVSRRRYHFDDRARKAIPRVAVAPYEVSNW